MAEEESEHRDGGLNGKVMPEAIESMPGISSVG